MMNMTKGGKGYVLPVTKQMTFWLTSNGSDTEKPWLIDGWAAEFDGEKPHKRPVPAIGEGFASPQRAERARSSRRPRG